MEASVRRPRSWSTGTGPLNFRTMFAPPAKSMPQLMPCFTNIAAPTIIQISEKATAWKRHLTKSYLVLTKICMGSSLNADRRGAVLGAVVNIEDHARDEERGEHGGEEADQQRDGEAFDRTGPELEQEERRDDRGHVRVDDRAEGAGEAVLDGRAHGLAVAQLLADALEDEHVRVDGHAEGQDDAGDAGERQRGLEDRHHAENDHEVEQQRQNGVDPGALVVDEHRGDEGDETDERRQHALVDGVAAERRPDGALLEGIERRRQRAAAQDEREVGGALRGERALDDSLILNLTVDHGGGDDFLVEDDG